MGRCSEFFQNFDGTPCEIHWTDDFEDDAGQDKLFRIMSIADRNSWIMTCSILKNMKKDSRLAKMGFLKDIGLINQHSYTIIDVKELVLDNGDIEYMLFLRNPAGNFWLKDDEVSKLDWGPRSAKWTPKTRKQCNYYPTEEQMQKAKEKGLNALKKFQEREDVPKLKKSKKKKAKAKAQFSNISNLKMPIEDEDEDEEEEEGNQNGTGLDDEIDPQV